MHTHSHSSSVYTMSDEELHSLEQSKLGRRIEGDIDDIIASYAHIPPTKPLDPCADVQPHCDLMSVAKFGAAASITSAYPASRPSHSPPTPSSTYSEPSPCTTYSKSPSISMKATLERFRDTPPPAPGWDKVSFGRETGLFGPDAFSDFPGCDLSRSGVDGFHSYERFGNEAEGRAGRRKDWRREFARRGAGRGYAVL